MIVIWMLHALYSTTLACLLSLAVGRLTPWIAVVSLLIGTAVAIWHGRSFRETHPEFRWLSFSANSGGTLEVVLFTFLIYVGVRHFVWLFYDVDHAWSTLVPYNFGDLPLHLNYIRSFANGISFPPQNAAFATERLLYPYGPDLYNALFEILGIRIQAHLAVVGVCALLASLVSLRAFAGWWGLGAFFLSGGLAGWDFVKNGMTNSHQNVDWKNLFLSVFVTQRGMIFALPAGLFLLQTFSRHVSGERPLSRRQMTALGLTWAILPLFHLHSFVAVSILMLGFAIAHGGVRGAREFLFSRMALIAYVPATLQVLASTDFLKRASVVKIQPGWMAPSGEFLSFMILNFGPWLVLPFAVAIALFFRSRETSQKPLWREFAFELLLFTFFMVVMLAPWPWDNIKVLVWPYLGLARLAWITIDPYLEKFGGAISQGMIAVVLFFSGFSVVLWSVQSPSGTGVKLYQVGELASAQGALRDVPKTAIFAAATTHDHVLTYFGRMRVVGYEGHIWSHGIDGSRVIPKLKTLLRGEEGWREAAGELGIQYVYWGPQEVALYGPEKKPWMSVYENVSRVPGHAVYRVR